MAAFVLHVDAVVTCSHQGTVKITPTQTRATVGGRPIATAADAMVVTGCPGVPPGPPPVCVSVAWTAVSTAVRAGGSPVLLQTAPPAGAPVPGPGVVTGPPPPVPLVTQMQLRVTAR